MWRPVALLLAFLIPAVAGAVETMRIAMGEGTQEVRIQGPSLAWGPDSEEAVFSPGETAVVTVRRHQGKLELNGALYPDESVRFRAGGEAVNAPLKAGGFEVRGDVVVRLHRDRLQLINVIPLEDYLAAVLGGEMPVSFPLEALKAQAVAARTYALQRKLETYSEAFHLGSSVLHQVYKGLHREDARTRSAVLATRGEVLTFELEPIEAYFHSSCGGRTETGLNALQRDLPYLQSVDCPCGSLPASRWTLHLSENEVTAALRHSSPGLSVTSRTRTGRVQRLNSAGGGEWDGVTFRQRLGYSRVKSLGFDLTKSSDGYHLTGRGYGHGAGLCQWGAKALADKGMGYRDILSHYYPGTELQQLY